MKDNIRTFKSRPSVKDYAEKLKNSNLRFQFWEGPELR